ncbi:DNA-binding response regulator [Paenibacillus baekrokdamisoli]|uniref:DNA-binding response regulator n=1 Tax=Paenibacillus baekrokdamisoli TaxID=1712516 RepID=A0A3G9J730_9BACL|nr:response regulator transcription factor [Paenibacillus baekrokdamisoli]MBB3069997.1 NarL family two-component system response regulator LiaR [Paenibacillus baekrokdamisoli]BBH20653.1 DNA-binding response regulator [Paenibacillus baekrokdamisoli]
MSHIKVVLVEDDPDWIKAMTVFLNKEEDLLLVGAATSSTEAIQLARTLTFDIVLMDIQLTGSNLDGIHTAMEMHEIHPAKVIMLSSLSDEHVMTQSFTAGAVNYIEKSNFKELPHAIRSAYHHPTAMDALLREFSRLKREEQLKELTTAEREVFELIEEGYTQPEIEKKLYKAESTLKNQVNKMLKKLGVKSSKEAVKKVKRKGIF